MVVTRAGQVAAGRADRVVQREHQPWEVVALGGYGRGELVPCSDVDLLFLHPGRPSEAVGPASSSRSCRSSPRRQWGRGRREPLVRFDSEGSATIVSVRAPDQPGLAYTIAATLAHLGLDITFAKIATAKTLALDVL